MVFILATPSLATSCPVGYKASGIWIGSALNGGNIYDGAQGDISLDTMTVPVGTTQGHALAFVASCTAGCYDTPNNTICTNSVNSGACQIQVGYGVGQIANSTSASRAAYEEHGDAFGYETQYWPSLGLSTVNWVNMHFTGTVDGAGNGLYNAYFSRDETGHTGVTLVGQAWLPNYAASTVSAFAEGENLVSGGCPGFGANQYFGRNAAGSLTGLSYTYNGISYFSWTAFAHIVNNAPYAGSVLANYYAYQTSGS